MRCTISTFALILFVANFAGCRTQSATMTNPFLAPDRVPPPATRSLTPGTAQPYYPGDPVPNMPTLGTPPGTFTPSGVQAPSTFAPQPAGTVPPGGWNSSPQQLPNGASISNGLPAGVQQAAAHVPFDSRSVVQIQPDQQSLRFSPGVYAASPAPSISVMPTNQPQLPPDPSILPTPQLPPNSTAIEPVAFNSPVPTQQFETPVVPVGQPREVRIRAISSDHLPAEGEVRSNDGFRPQGTSQVRKPTILSRLTPQKVQPPIPSDDRFGHEVDYTRLRGQLRYDAQTGAWDLRYAPEHGSSDPFGGQLAIANPQVLSGLKSGDFVQLHGKVDQTQSMPIYTAAVVQRQRI